MKFKPAITGLITAVVMIITALLLDTQRDSLDPRMQYLIFVIYAAGIFMAIYTHSRHPESSGKFGELFGQGFRCFIIITVCMVVFGFIFLKLHPEFAIQEAAHQREELEKLQGKSPSEIEDMVSQVKKQYAIRYLSASIFGYLIIGAGISAAISALLTRRK